MNPGVLIRYIYSACVVIETPDIKILCDPWFTDGVYDGSWFHFPVVDDPISKIGDCDYIYVSHLHPDHYDPIFLRRYMQVFGPKEILLAARKFPYLEKIALSSGFNCRVVSAPLRIGQTTVSLIAHKPEDMNEIDSVIHVEFSTRTRRHSVLNSNDVIFTDVFLKEIKEMFGEPCAWLVHHR